MHRPIILPEEYWVGYFWELRNINSRSFSPTFCHPRSKASKVLHRISENEIARLAGISMPQLEQLHTLAPYAIAGKIAQGRVKRAACAGSLPRGNLTPVRMLRYCPSCCAEDIEKHGRSYYRRSHQLPGVNWCSLHGFQRLVWTPKNKFGRSPEQWCGLKPPSDIPRWWQLSKMAQLLIAEFMQASEDLMNGGVSIDVDGMRNIWITNRIHLECDHNRHCVRLRSNSSNLSKLELPEAWLAMNFDRWVHWVDCCGNKQYASTSRTCHWLLASLVANVALKRTDGKNRKVAYAPKCATEVSSKLYTDRTNSNLSSMYTLGSPFAQNTVLS